MVGQTFAAFNLKKNGLLTFDEFRAMVEQNKGILSALTVNTSDIINA